MYKKIKELYQTQIPAKGLALFRIVYGLILLCEVLQGFYFRILFWETNRNSINHNALLLFFAFAVIAILFLIIGFKTRITTIFIYLLNLFTFSVTSYFEYHVDYGYTGINFMLMFMPISRVWSVDSVLDKLKNIRINTNFKPIETVSILNNYILVGVGVGVVYLDSIFYKLTSPMWLNGLGFWKPASIPQVTYLDLSFLLNNEFLSLSFGYVTLCFELVFLFFIWFKWARIPLVIIGLGLHLGILFAYPIPWFALTVASLYILLIPPYFWNKITQRIKRKESKLVVRYNPQFYIDNVLKTVVVSFDFSEKINFVIDSNIETVIIENNEVLTSQQVWKKVINQCIFLLPLQIILLIPFLNKKASVFYVFAKNNLNQLVSKPARIVSTIILNKLKLNLVMLFLIYVAFSQLLCINNSFLLTKYYTKNNFELPFLVTKKTSLLGSINRFLFGIVPHPVFMDFHFDGYNHIIAITHIDKNGNETWLPLIRENGQVSYYNTGRQWVNWTFRTNSPYVNSQALKRGIENYTYFWINKQKNINLDDATFKIKVKKIDIPTEWEEDFLKKQMAKPWQDVSEAKWKNGEFFIDLPDIESI